MEWNRCKAAFHLHGFQVAFVAKLVVFLRRLRKWHPNQAPKISITRSSAQYALIYDWIIAVWGKGLRKPPIRLPLSSQNAI